MPRYLVRRRTNVRSWIWPFSNGTAITLGHILDPVRESELRLEVVLDGMIVEIDDPERLADALPQLARPIRVESTFETAPEGLRGLPVWPTGWRPAGQACTMDEAIERFEHATGVTVPE